MSAFLLLASDSVKLFKNVFPFIPQSPANICEVHQNSIPQV